MARALHSAMRIAAAACWLGGVLFACHAALRCLDLPAWWTLPLGTSAAFGWLALRAGGERLRRRGGCRGEADVDFLAHSMRRAWDAGKTPRRNAGAGLLRLAPARPWFIAMRHSDDESQPFLELGDLDAFGTGGEFTWHAGRDILWLDAPFALDREEAPWISFLHTFRAGRGRTPLGGLAVFLDASRVVAAGSVPLRDEARTLRRRLERFGELCGETAPAYLIVTGLDRLYGMRTLASLLDEDRLRRPLGGLRGDARIGAGDFARRIIAGAGAALAAPPSFESDQFTLPAPALQAGEELARLEAPLSRFCDQVFGMEKAGGGATLRGLFLCSSGPDGKTIPSLLSRWTTFREAGEKDAPALPWFVSDLLRKELADDVAAARAFLRPKPNLFAFHAGVLGLFAGMAILCWLLTWSFLESRNILISAAGRAHAPETAENLGPYLDLASRIRLRNADWRLPRFGMNEAEELEEELGKRYAESYFDLKTVPGVEGVQEAALAAARSRDPAEIGAALLRLALIRDGISRNIGDPRRPSEGGRLLRALADALRLTDSEDMRQLDAYLAWAGGQDWMPETRDALADFEKHIIDNANDGDMSWLPEWIASLPGLEAADTSGIWDSPRPSAPADGIGAAWTRDGYVIASAFLEAIAYGRGGETQWREKKAAILARYRIVATDKWQDAAATVWTGFRDRIPDAEIKRRVRDIIARRDPASRFVALARDNLLPMFEGESDEPAIRWLRLQDRLVNAAEPAPGRSDGDSDTLAERLAGVVRALASDRERPASPNFGLASGDRYREAERHWKTFSSALGRAALLCDSPGNLASIRDHFRTGDDAAPATAAADPYAQAGEAASALHSYLRETSGCASWDGLSPLAIFDYLRYLASRRAALSLDALWRDTVYSPTQLISGDERERAERLLAKGGRLEGFLTEAGGGFWRWREGRLENARWDRLEFMFEPAFLNLCTQAVSRGFSPPPRTMDLALRVESISVDREARERPIRVDFLFRTPEGEQEFAFRNYAASHAFCWDRERSASAIIRLHFPSITAEVEFSGEKGIRDFIRLFSDDGVCVMDPDIFTDSAPTLRRLGVRRIMFRASMANAAELLSSLENASPTVPRSIIVPDKTAPGGAVRVGALYGPFY